MKKDFEMEIYGGKFVFSTAARRYRLYKSIVGEALDRFDEDWALRKIKESGRKTYQEAWRDELESLSRSMQEALDDFVEKAEVDFDYYSGLKEICVRGLNEIERQGHEFESVMRAGGFSSREEICAARLRGVGMLLMMVHQIAESVRDLMLDALVSDKIVAIPKKGGEKKGEKLFEALKANEVDEAKKDAAKLAALNAMPQNVELIAWCWADDEDKRAIKELAKGVGVSLKKVEDKAFRELAGPCDLSTEKKALAYREKAEKAAKQIDYYKGKDVLSEVDEALEAFDREARCVDDKVFATREEAAKQRKISEFEAGLDVSTEEEALKSKRELLKLIGDLGVDGSWKLARIDKALAKFEKVACTAGGRVFPTREEAVKQRELVTAEAKVDLSCEASALAAKNELETLISRLGIDGDWKLERVNKALRTFDELARTAFGVVYKTRDEAAAARSSRQAFFAALEQAVKDAGDEKFYLKDEIPEKKLTGAMTYLSSENCEGVFALLDTTLFGSAKLGLVATRIGIVWKNEYLETRRNSYSWQELGALPGELILKKDTEIWFEDGVAYEDSGSDAVHEEVFKVLCKFKRYASEATFWGAPEIVPSAVEERRVGGKDSTAVQSICKSLAALKVEEVFTGDKIPEKKRMNAFTSMRVKEPMSSVKVLVDATVWGSAKDGLVITDRALYFKNMMEDPIRIELPDIKKVKAEGKDILFNDQRFSPGVFDEKVIVKIAKCFKVK